MNPIFLKGRKSLTNKQTKLTHFKNGFIYVESIENRPKRFYDFSLNFDFKKFQKGGAIIKIFFHRLFSIIFMKI